MYSDRFTGAGVSAAGRIGAPRRHARHPAKTPAPNTADGARKRFTQRVDTCRCDGESSCHCLVEPEIAFAHGAVQCLEALLQLVNKLVESCLGEFIRIRIMDEAL